MYYTPEIMDIIVENTNNYARRPRNDMLLESRINQWYPTCHKELYLYFAIRIYIILHVLNEIFNYWDISKNTLTHDFTDLIPRNRF